MSQKTCPCGMMFRGSGGAIYCRPCSGAINEKIRLYHSQKRTTVEMGELLDMHHNTIRTRMRDMGLSATGRRVTAPIHDTGSTSRGDKPVVVQATIPGVDLNLRRSGPIAQAKECQFPFGDPRSPDFHFCGKKPVARSYCASCFVLCYERGRPSLTANAT